jgi:hypothetical protein
MKKIIFLFSLGAIIATSGCKKDPENQVFITESNLTAYIGGCVARDAKGLFTQIDDATTWTLRGINASNACTYVKDSTFSVSSPSTSAYTYSFASGYHTDIQCNTTPPAPNLVHFSFTHNGVWQNALAKGNGNGNAAWNIINLNASDSNLKISGAYTRSGNATDKNDNNSSFSTDLRMTLKDVLIDKTTKQLQSGTIEYSVVGASSSTTDYDYIGYITIQSHTTARLTIGSKNYTINLDTGAVN